MLTLLRSSPPYRCGGKFQRASPYRVLSLMLAYVGTGLAMVGESVLRLGHRTVRASYRLDGQEDLD